VTRTVTVHNEKPNKHRGLLFKFYAHISN